VAPTYALVLPLVLPVVSLIAALQREDLSNEVMEDVTAAAVARSVAAAAAARGSSACKALVAAARRRLLLSHAHLRTRTFLGSVA
jgi:hypothetical protein